jgi:predicted Zn-dependent protease
MLIDSPEINAGCLPGGKMIFYTGLIQRLQLTNAEIAAVMAHEMAHALREHGRERISQAMAQGLIVDIASGYTNNAPFINQVMHYTLMLPNSRAAESEADRIGLELMARAGYDPQAAITLHQKMSAQGGGQPPEFLSDHPGSASRAAELNRLIPLVMPLYQMAPKP